MISNAADYVVVKAEVGLCLLPVNASTEDQYKRMVLGEGHDVDTLMADGGADVAEYLHGHPQK